MGARDHFVIPTREKWALDAACRGVHPKIMFASGIKGVMKAKALCATCPVMDECGEAALARGEQYGVWGGMSERERRRIRRQRRNDAAA